MTAAVAIVTGTLITTTATASNCYCNICCCSCCDKTRRCVPSPPEANALIPAAVCIARPGVIFYSGSPVRGGGGVDGEHRDCYSIYTACREYITSTEERGSYGG